VAIIGWDDQLETQAPYPGAWIVKNSWGDDWGYDGYFYISYYDKWSCREPEMGAVSFQNVEPLQYEFTYYHDYHGWRDTKTGCQEAFNKFIASSGQDLKAVSFFVADNDVNFQVIIFDDFNGSELSNELNSLTGWIENKGFHTFELEQAVTLAGGNDFYIYLYLENGGHPYDRTSEVPVLLGGDQKTLVESNASPEESYYMENGNWLDFYYYNDPSGYEGTGNFCIKGLSIPNPWVGANEINPLGTLVLCQNAPNPFNERTSIRYILPGENYVSLKIYDIAGKEIATLVNELQGAGEHIAVWAPNKEINDGVYFYVLRSGKYTTSGKMVVR